jgi:hypothetical protein
MSNFLKGKHFNKSQEVLEKEVVILDQSTSKSAVSSAGLRTH